MASVTVAQDNMSAFRELVGDNVTGIPLGSYGGVDTVHAAACVLSLLLAMQGMCGRPAVSEVQSAGRKENRPAMNRAAACLPIGGGSFTFDRK